MKRVLRVLLHPSKAIKILLHPSRIPWYDLILSFRKGQTIVAALTFGCNLDCGYCAIKVPTGKRPKSKILFASFWFKALESLGKSVKIKEVLVTGGEPGLHPYCREIIEGLIDRGYHVTVYSNLANYHRLMIVNNCYRYQIAATFHECEPLSQDAWCGRSSELESAGYKIKIYEVGTKQRLPWSTLKPYINCDDLKTDTIYIAPDCTLHLGYYNCFVNKSL